MSTSKSCTARQIRLQKLESDHQQCLRTSYKMLKKCWMLWKMRCLTKVLSKHLKQSNVWPESYQNTQNYQP